MIAMKFGDNCWLKNLTGSPQLNGRRVTLHEWLDDKQRWKCRPMGWNHAMGFVAVRPKNLCNEPPPKTPPGVPGSAVEEAEVRRRLAQNVAAMAAADQEVSSDEEAAEKMFNEMQQQAEEKLQRAAFDAFGPHWPGVSDATAFIANLSTADAKSYTDEVHEVLQRMFDSRHDPAIVKKTGVDLHRMGGLQCMKTAFYNYQRVLLKTGNCAQWSQTRSRDLWNLLKLDVLRGWKGIGGWAH